MEQFYTPSGDPDAYWQEALRRDPGDIRVNTVLGIDAIKGGRYADAERLLSYGLRSFGAWLLRACGMGVTDGQSDADNPCKTGSHREYFAPFRSNPEFPRSGIES
jgi:hypothetical protein